MTEGICNDWKAKWIWKDHEVKINDFAFFRREIFAEKSVRLATVYVSAHNYLELFINSIKVSGYMTPVPSHPQKSKYYLTYDITDLLNVGNNAFCAVVHYIGGHGQNYVNGLPGFIMQCKVIFDDGMQTTFITDEAWKVQGDTPYRTGVEFQQNRKISAIEDYDARKEDDKWLYSGFDDTYWDMACLSCINHEGWILKPQAIPEGKVHEVITPVPSGIQEKGLQVFDAGKIISGWPRFELPGVEGVQVRMRYSEDLDETGRVKHNVCNEKSENYFDQYTMKGRKTESWEPCFSYKAFRYVEVTGYPEIIRPENIGIISAGTGLSYEGRFNSSSQLLNDIYHACIQTQINNVVGQMVDCPHREQAQYLADSDLQAETFVYNFTDTNVLRKVLLDFKDGQFEDGRFPFVFPTNLDNPDFHINIPEWDLHFVTLLWKVYFIDDDIKILESCYEAAKKAVDHYLGQRNKTTGLVPRAEGFPKGWNISDWPYPDIDETGEFLTVQNCLLYHVTGLMSDIASILGKEGDAAVFARCAHELKSSILKYLYNADSKCFADSYRSGRSHQGTNVIAYHFGLVPANDRKAVLDKIIDAGFGCSTLLSLNLLQVLFENGCGQVAYNMLNTDGYPSWGHMIAKGYQTMWEGFQDIESHCHAWNAYPARIFTEYLVGIKAIAPGFQKIRIRPYLPDGLLFAEGKVPSIKGDIYVKWERKDEELAIAVIIPAGVCAQVHIPKLKTGVDTVFLSGEAIWKDGLSIGKDKNLVYNGEENGYMLFETEPGDYLFYLRRYTP